jgi:hypothetical protein
MIERCRPVWGIAIVLALVLGAFLIGVPASAADKVGSAHFEGLVQHMSTNNIKVTNPKDKSTMSFLLVPHFKNVFSDDGKTTAQMSSLHEGQYVKVFYDQKLLGARHADRILILNNSNMKMGVQKG